MNNRLVNSIKKRMDELKDFKFKSVKMTIHHKPIPSARPRQGKYTFYVPGAAKNRKMIHDVIKPKLKDFDPITTEVRVIIKCYTPIPSTGLSLTDKHLAEEGYIRPTTKPDVDNYAKTYMDALNGVLWLDDGQVTELNISKHYSENPRVEIIVKYANMFTSKSLESNVKKTVAYKQLILDKKK